MKEIILAAQIAGISATPFLQFWRDIDIFSAQLGADLPSSQAVSFNDRMERVKELAIPFYKSGGVCDSEYTFPTFVEVESTPYDTRLSEASNLKKLASMLDDWISSFVCLEGNLFEDKKNLHVLGRIVENFKTLAKKFEGEDAPEFYYYEISGEFMGRDEAANYCYGKDMWLAEPGMDAARKQMLVDSLPETGQFWFDGDYSCSSIDKTGVEVDEACESQLQALCEGGEFSETTTTKTTTTTTTKTLVPPEDCLVLVRGESHLTYDDARQTCEDDGMYLYYSKNSDEFDEFLEQDMSRTEWYGLKRTSRYSSSWRTSDGFEGPTYGNDDYYVRWNAGEPNNSGYNEGCAMLNMNRGKMNDIPCDRNFAYTCAKMISFGEEHTSDEERCMCTATGLVCKPKYTCTLFEKQKEKSTFDGAKDQCAQNDATLAFFKTEEEFEQFLDDDDDDSRGKDDDEQWIGYERTGLGVNDWQTVDGSTDFFAEWKDGEPDNDDDNEYCAEIDIKKEEMSDVDCNGKEKKFSCRQELIAGEIVVKEKEICECTEDGIECEKLSHCPEFVRMEGEVTYADAKAQCAELNGHVAFFEDEDEFDKFMDDDNFKRKEWMGIEYVGPYNSAANWVTADGGDEYYSNWNFGEPNGGWSEPCAEINMNNRGKYNDVRCDGLMEFSCRIIKITRGKCD